MPLFQRHSKSRCQSLVNHQFLHPRNAMFIGEPEEVDVFGKVAQIERVASVEGLDKLT